VKKGDRVEIDFQGFDDGGAPMDKTSSKNHPLFVGEGNLVEGFEENLVGMKIGEKKKFPVKFPKTYHYEPLKEKTVHFEVEMKKGEEAILPELTEEFIAQLMGEKKTLPEFKDALKADIKRRKEVEHRQERENKLLERFLKDAELEVPPILIAEETEYMMEDLAKDLERRKVTFADYLKQTKKKEEDLKKQFEPEAEKRVKVRLILNFLFREMKIDVTDAELDEAKNLLAAQYPDQEKAKVDADFKAKGNMYLRIKNNLMLEKLFKKFLD
jgi:trigger factor